MKRLACVVIALATVTGVASAEEPARTNLASFGAGALIVKQPDAYDQTWSGFWLLDEDPETGYATLRTDVTPKEFVIELADQDKLDEVGFDNKHVDGGGTDRGAKDISVDIGDKVDGPWRPFMNITLAPGQDNQRFKAAAPGIGRYLRVTAKSSQGSALYIELMGFAAYGTVDKKLPMPDISGDYMTRFGEFRVKATGSTAVGCYEWHDGLIKNGAFESRVLRFTWSEYQGKSYKASGPAMMVFPSDGKSMFGMWWDDKGQVGGRWDGKLLHKNVEECPHYKFDAPAERGGDVAAALRDDGRARLYGIAFDFDSDHLREDAKGTLALLVATAKAQPSWKLAIEGHTDNVGGAARNQELSQQRADAVKAYLVKAGVPAGQLSAKGYGATKPFTTNGTVLGRSQNRRVEVTRN